MSQLDRYPARRAGSRFWICHREYFDLYRSVEHYLDAVYPHNYWKENRGLRPVCIKALKDFQLWYCLQTGLPNNGFIIFDMVTLTLYKPLEDGGFQEIIAMNQGLEEAICSLAVSCGVSTALENVKNFVENGGKIMRFVANDGRDRQYIQISKYQSP